VSSIFAWLQGYIMAGVTQRTVLRHRRDVDHKLGRLPLRYFDSHPRGDLLSRVTNDIDNIGQSLQQILTQLITSLPTIVGVLIMMLTISPILAVPPLLAVIGCLRVASGQMSLGDVVAFIQYSRQFTFPIIQTASIVNVLQSAVASAERVFELLDEREQSADPVGAPAFREPKGAVSFE